jgi:hypothetical protein
MSTEILQYLQIEELQREVRELRREVAILRSSDRRCHDNGDALPRALAQLIVMTNELIPGEIRVENSVDPDDPDTVCVVFHVAAHLQLGDANAVIDTEVEWHRRARAIYPDATCHFRLAID